MEGYFLFRGDILVASNPYSLSAWGLHDQGQEGDILVSLHPTNIATFKWCDKGLGQTWGTEKIESTDKYRLLVLLQK